MYIFIDLDGVLADFAKSAIKKHNKYIHPNEITWDIPTQIGFDCITSPDFWNPLDYDFWANLPWTTEGKEIYEQTISHYGKDKCFILTAPAVSKGCIDGKIHWIKKNLDIPYLMTNNKHVIAKGNLLIDDRNENHDSFIQHGGKCVLVPRPWNRLKHESNENADVSDIQKLIFNIKSHS
mgnify:FL=1